MKRKPVPRIAIAFFGIPRCSNVCFPSIRRHFLEPLREAGEVHVFYHLYRQIGIENTRSGETGSLDPENYAPFASFEGELEDPGPPLHRWRYPELRAYGDRYDDDGRSLANLIHQLHSLHKVTSAVLRWNPDVVVFLRPDLLYHDPVDPVVIKKCFRAPHSLFLPYWQPWGGRNDRFAICGAEAYLAYGKRVERALEFCQSKDLPLHAEELLEFALVRGAVRIGTVGWRASRVRLGGHVKEESFVQPYDPRWSARLRRLFAKLLGQIDASGQ